MEVNSNKYVYMFLCIRTNEALCKYINCYMNFIVSHELSKMTCGRPYACDDKDDLDVNVDICGSILDVGKKVFNIEMKFSVLSVTGTQMHEA